MIDHSCSYYCDRPECGVLETLKADIINNQFKTVLEEMLYEARKNV